MIRTQVYLQDQQYHMAKLLADAKDIAFSEFIRHGVDLAIEETHKKTSRASKKRGALDGVLGKYSVDGARNIATTHNDIYDI